LNRDAVTRFTPLRPRNDGTLDAESIAKPLRIADLTIRVLRTEELTATQRASVITVCIAAHDNDDFKNLFTYIPEGGRHFLAYRGSELVSHAVVTTRWLQPDGGRLLRTAYVDAVATSPTHQHHGFATAVMRRLASAIDDFEIGCLQTDRMRFYERLGWLTWQGPLAGRSDAGLIPTPDQRGVMVLLLRTTPPLDRYTQLTIERQPSRIWE
jgi:aminoglycoside 2'-N-acetyltransferase I